MYVLIYVSEGEKVLVYDATLLVQPALLGRGETRPVISDDLEPQE